MKWSRKHRRQSWVTWESEQAEVKPGVWANIIPGETIPDGIPIEEMPLIPPPAGPGPADPVEQILSDFGEGSPAAGPPPLWEHSPWSVPYDTPRLEDPEPARPPAPPPSAGSTQERRSGPRVSLRKPGRAVELARRHLPARRTVHLPAPPWWVIPAGWRWTRRQAPAALMVGGTLALMAGGALAVFGVLTGLSAVASLRWEIAAPTLAAIAGTVARLVQEIPRAYNHARNRWTTVLDRARERA